MILWLLLVVIGPLGIAAALHGRQMDRVRRAAFEEGAAKGFLEGRRTERAEWMGGRAL